MFKRTVYGIILLLVLITTSALLFGVHLAKSENNLLLTMRVNKTVIALGESIDITLTLKNVGENIVNFTFNPPFFDVYYCTSEKCYYWSDGLYFIQVILNLILEPGENYTETLHWNLYRHINGEYCPPELGTYDLFGVAIWAGVTTESIPITVYWWNTADVNHDLEVNLYDAIPLLAIYGSELGDKDYNSQYDIAEPYGKIDLYDAVLLLSNYGKKFI